MNLEDLDHNFDKYHIDMGYKIKEKVKEYQKTEIHELKDGFTMKIERKE